MTMDCVLADEQALGDGVVAEADRYEFKHLELTHCQSAALLTTRGLSLRREPEPDY